MATAKQRSYAAAMNRVIKRFETMEDATVRQMVAFLEQYRRDVIGYLSNVPDDSFASFALGEVKANIEAQTETLRRQLVTMQNQALQTAVTDGVEMVVEPLIAAGIEGTFFRSSVAQINVLMDFSADLITGLANDVIKLISSEISRVGLGALTPYQAMQKVTEILGVKGGRQIVGGIASRAETIVRTETNRAFSVANQAQQQASREEFPNLQKAWMSTGDPRTRRAHLDAHGQTVDVDKPFIVGGEKMMHPHDPAASAKNTVNCRCRTVTVHPEIGLIDTPLDEQIEAEKERRDERSTSVVANFKNHANAKLWFQENLLADQGDRFFLDDEGLKKWRDSVVQIDGIPLDLLEAAGTEFKAMRDKYNLPGLTSITNSSSRGNAFAYYAEISSGDDIFRELNINPDFVKNLQEYDGWTVNEFFENMSQNRELGPRYFIESNIREAMYHEATHYYHAAGLGKANVDIQRAYQIATDSGLLDHVSMYASENAPEFFAELAVHKLRFPNGNRKLLEAMGVDEIIGGLLP